MSRASKIAQQHLFICPTGFVLKTKSMWTGIAQLDDKMISETTLILGDCFWAMYDRSFMT